MASEQHKALFGMPVSQGASNAHEAIMADACNRYQCKPTADSDAGGKTNWLLKCETELADYFGQRFGIGVNSGGMAIMLGLKAMHRVLLQNAPNCIVYSNSFTFNAVPSAIVNAGFTPSFIQTTPFLTIDEDDFERQVKEDLAAGTPSGNMILVLSYMRGRIPNMDRILEICAKYQVLLLEDNAHGYGAQWNGRKIGNFGVVSTISTQANKLINTGEGGFIFTSNDAMHAFFMFSAGCYEELFKKHETLCPNQEAIEAMRFTVPNWSCRMSNLQAALAYPQIAILPSRITAHNSNYYRLQKLVAMKLRTAKKSETCTGQFENPEELVEFIPQLPAVSPVYDSVQMRVKLPEDGLAAFVSSMNEKNFKLQLFTDKFNARYYRSWKYCVSEQQRFARTDAVLEGVVDMRLLAHDTDEDVNQQADAIATSFLHALSLHAAIPSPLEHFSPKSRILQVPEAPSTKCVDDINLDITAQGA